jgi:hypothetical protein
MDELESKMLDGQWSFPKEINFSLQGIQFLNALLNFDEEQRPDWPEIG